ncbi:MAG: NAD(P)/FAD-dependent oxidoreductase [Actinomycetota bacterium]
MSKPPDERPVVVVVGGGFAGLSAVKQLKRARVRTVLIDKNNYNLFAPLLYQVGTALLDPSEIAHPIRGLIQPVRNCEFLMATVTGFDLQERIVRTDRGDVAYDYLIVALGSETNFFSNRSIERRSVAMKTLEDAIALRNEVLRRFEEARWASDPAERARLLTFMIIGGGSTGVETAGAIQELVRRVLKKDFKEMSLDQVQVILLEAADRLLPPFHPNLQQKALKTLEKMSVKVMFGAAVKRVDRERVILSDRSELPGGLVVWTAGVKASSLGSDLSSALSTAGTVKVEETLQLPGHPEVFVVGDLAAFDFEGSPLPMLGAVAGQEGKRAGRNLRALVEGKPQKPFHYRNKGMMSTIGRNSAVVQFRRLRFGGFIGWAAWLFVHLVLIVSFRTQLVIIWNWFWNYLSNDRPARLILDGEAIEKAEAG